MKHRPLAACAVGLLIAFIGLGVVAHLAGDGTAVDHAVLGWLLEHRRAWLTTVAVAITTAGSPVAMGLLALVAALALWRRRHTPIPGIVLLATLLTASGTSTLAKVIVGARRPPRSVQLVLEVDPSFPSGHVTGTLALLGAIAVILGRGRRLGDRIALGCLVFAATLAVALTRLYLGVHWLSDIGGGLLLGGLAVLVCSIVLDVVTPPPSTPGGRTVETPIAPVARMA